MSLTRQVAGGAVWLVAARIGGQVFGLASTVVVARFILPDDYGVFAAAMSVLMMVSVFAELPVSQALIHLRDIREDDYDTAFTIGILRGGILAVLMLILATPLAAFMNEARIAPVTAALGGYVALLGLRNPRLESFARDMDFSREALVEICSKLASFIAAAACAVLLKNYWALVFGIIAAALVQVILSFAVRPVMPRITLSSFNRLFSYSVWMAGSSILGQIYQLIDTLALGRLRGSAALGTYSIGSLLSARISEVVAIPASRSLFAAFSSIQSERERLQGAFLQSMTFMAALLVPTLMTLIWFAEPIVLIVLGPQWETAIFVVELMAILMITHIVYTPLMAMLMGLGYTQTLFLRSLLFVIVYLPVAVLAVMRGGLEGLLIVKVSMILGLTLIDCLIVRHHLGISLHRQGYAVARPMIAGVAMAIIYLIADGWVPHGHSVLSVGFPLAAICAAGAASYLGTLLALWHIAGRPEGVEAKALAALDQGLQRFGPAVLRR
ncbi:MAG: lipopolysaccharide biosynthesis protein [Pseudomonadota bacterium]